MNSSQTKRLWVVVVGLVFATTIVVGRLFAFQVIQATTWAERINDTATVIALPDRGIIYDRNGAILASNTADYQINAAPRLIIDAEEIATRLSPILNQSRTEILASLTANSSNVVLAGRVDAEVANYIRDLDYDGIQIDPLPRRYYPQDDLMCHTLGYVDFTGRGGSGLEGYYQRDLEGKAATAQVNISPLAEQESVIANEGADLVLTIDRSVQYLVEEHLERALRTHGASSGTIIVMDPKTGAILAMANAPCYTPYDYYNAEEDLLLSPSVSQQHEPGSVMKLVTMAAALDSGVVTPSSTYYDGGVLEVGGHKTYNWDRSAPGETDMTTLLARSLNVGAASLAMNMGSDDFYDYMQAFGFGRPLGVDLMAEANGQLPLPGSSYWTEAFMATTAYGQGIAVTPLQMITAVSALANEGTMMTPYLVQEMHTHGEMRVTEPRVASRPISSQTAQQVTTMATAAVAREVLEAQIPGYTIAGKTGTAQIAENGFYLEYDVIGSFIGWLPADDPEIIVYVKLDRPQFEPWGSKTAAPTFAELTEELVVLMDIPPDNVRLQADILAIRQENE